MPKLPLARAKRIAHGVRIGRKVTIAEVARGIGITRGHLGEIEAVRATASDEVTALLANFYDCTAEDLEGKGKPDKPPKQPQGPKGPRRREESDTKGPTRVEGAA